MFIFVFHSTFAQVSGEYYNGCRSFYNVKWAHSYFKVANRADIDIEEPVMVNYGAGYESNEFKSSLKSFQLNLFQKLNYEIARKVLFRSVDQSINIYYLIDTQKMPSSGRTINHMISYLPGWISKNYCRHYCEDETKLKNYISEKLDGISRYNPKRYTFEELSESLSFLISSLNNKIDRREFKTYEDYLKSYFFMFKGTFGILMLTSEIQEIVGLPLTKEEFRDSSKRHNEKIDAEDVEDAYRGYLKMIKNNWSKVGNIITKNLASATLARENSGSYEEKEERLTNEISTFSQFTLHAPDIVAQTFKENTLFSDNYCLIYDLVDYAYVTQGSLESGESSQWYLAPILLGMLFIPFILTGGAIFAMSWIFYGLTAITVADIGMKSYKLYNNQQEKEFAHFLTSMSERDQYQLQELLKMKAQFIQDGKAVGAILALELIGLGIASKVIKVTEKIYQKISRVDMIDDVIRAASRSDLSGKSTRFFLMQKNISINDLETYLAKLSDKEMFEFMMKLKSASIGKKVFASELAVEGTKMSYVYANSSFYGEINPATIIFDVLTKKYLNKEKQYELDASLDGLYISP
ncbi:hypothetical protein [Bacteriovorax sp. Seq25_V]|uniref:hypothetical protein n=1 Tax=Bacteriovorax sp. Seq25_V TaxID=1201288 RepID=UPI00038A1BF0|nr:hypothetical protein [Bacteriovorax sp. Seq25_V]EQC47386.1 hypothetical protein M900_0783 [Bacteriovorax sp. Seq25_V]